MKNRFCKIITNALIVTLFSFQCHLLVAQSISVEPDYIEFDWEAGNSRDALTISDDSGVEIEKPEYYPWDNNRNNPIAYIKSQSNRIIKVQFKSSNFDGQAHLLINLTKSGGTGTAIGSVCSLFIPNYDFYNPDEREITFTGTFPTEVGKHNFTWEWEIYAIPVNDANYCATWSTSYTEHIYYTLFAVPQAPVAQPWANVLDLACTWAANKTTEKDILSAITVGAYNYFSQFYEYNPNYTHTSLINGFHLSQFLIDDMADCQDMSAVLQIFTRMLGGTNTRILYIDDKSPFLENFAYKKIKPIGLGWIEGNQYNYWSFHQVAWLDNVYDACIILDFSNPRIPVNEDIDDDYKPDLFNHTSTDSLTSGAWSPKFDNIFDFTSVD